MPASQARDINPRRPEWASTLPTNTYATLPEAALYLRVSQDTIRRWILTGRLPAAKIGRGAGRYRIPVRELFRAIDEAVVP